MPDARPLRCAVIGAGRMGMVHGHLLQVYPGTELVGFVDPQRGAHERLASQGLRAPVFTGIPEMLASANPEAVFICTPTHTHLAVTRECLARPLHLFMEKPVATSVADADAILALAREHRVMHAAGYVYAHLPIVDEARCLLAEGVLGEVLRFSAHAYISEVFGPKSGWFFQRELSGGGVVANMGSHVLFILGWMFGRIRRVMATTRSHASNVEDSAHALLWFAGDQHLTAGTGGLGAFEVGDVTRHVLREYRFRVDHLRVNVKGQHAVAPEAIGARPLLRTRGLHASQRSAEQLAH